MAQVAGTPMHSGILMLSATPNGFSGTSASLSDVLQFPSYMASPHVFMSANEATSVCLEIPFYAGTELVRSEVGVPTANVNTFDYGELNIVVVNPLGVPTSGSTTLTVSIHAMFVESEFYVPHVDPTFVTNSKIIDQVFSFATNKVVDFIDMGRQLVRQYTGLHNPNVSTPEKRVVIGSNMINAVDRPSFYEDLSPFQDYQRVARDYVFRTRIDEMSLPYILSKPAYLASFSVDVSTPVGKVLYSRPITPFQSNVYVDAVGSRALYTPLELLSSCCSQWKGSFKIHIQASMTNFNYCKLLVAKNYSPVVAQLTQVPAFADVQNFLTDTLEFSSGGQVQTIELPYLSPLKMLSFSLDPVTNVFQHGMYYIYLMQPLVSNGSVPTTVNFNVYISAGEDFALYGVGVDTSREIVTYSAPSLLLSVDKEEELIVMEPNSAAAPVTESVPLQLMNDSAILDDKVQDDEYLRPILSVRDLSRRMIPVTQVNAVNTVGGPEYKSFQIAELLGLVKNKAGITTVGTDSILNLLAGLYRGFTGSIKLRLLVTGSISVHAFYVPPTMRYGSSSDSDGIKIAKAPTLFPFGVSTVDIAAKAYVLNATNPNAASNTGTLILAPHKLHPDVPNITTSNNQIVLDFTVPNMSPMRCIGDLNIRGPNNNYFAADLGSIVVSYDVLGSTTTTNGIRFYVGTTDESRYGFQSICLPRRITATSLVFPASPNFFISTMLPMQAASTDANPSLPYALTSLKTPACYI